MEQTTTTSPKTSPGLILTQLKRLLDEAQELSAATTSDVAKMTRLKQMYQALLGKITMVIVFVASDPNGRRELDEFIETETKNYNSMLVNRVFAVLAAVTAALENKR